MLASQELCSMD